MPVINQVAESQAVAVFAQVFKENMWQPTANVKMMYDVSYDASFRLLKPQFDVQFKAPFNGSINNHYSVSLTVDEIIDIVLKLNGMERQEQMVYELEKCLFLTISEVDFSYYNPRHSFRVRMSNKPTLNQKLEKLPLWQSIARLFGWQS